MPYDDNGNRYDKDYVFLHVSFDESLKGGYDEGYYYDHCDHCGRKTEHDDLACIECSDND
jgi:hypothetical protein